VLRIGEDTIVTGDLIRAHKGGALMSLPHTKLTDPVAAHRSVVRIANMPAVETVLVGDGWHLFSGARAALNALVTER